MAKVKADANAVQLDIEVLQGELSLTSVAVEDFAPVRFSKAVTVSQDHKLSQVFRKKQKATP